MDAAHKSQSVKEQDAASDSILNAFREFMQWRKTQPVLIEGDIEFIETSEPLLAFYRRYEGKTMLCVFNLSVNSACLVLDGMVLKAHNALPHQTGTLDTNNTLTLPGFGCFYADVN